MEEDKKSRLKEKAMKAGEAGMSTLGAILEKRKKERQAREKFSESLSEQYGRTAGGSPLARVEMGMPPTLDEQGVPMKSAMGLLTERYKPALEGADASALQVAMGKEVQGSVPKSRTGHLSVFDERKRRVVQGSINRRNPELYPKPGAAQSENVSSSLLKQLDRLKRPDRGRSYES